MNLKMRDIFEKDFIVKVLIPLAVTMLVSGVLFILGNAFILLVAVIIFAGLFFFTKYNKDLVEEEIYYEEEDTSPIRELREELNLSKDYTNDSKANSYDYLKDNMINEDNMSFLDIEDEEGEALHFEKADMSLTQQIKASVDEDYPEPTLKKPVRKSKAVSAPKKKAGNVISKSIKSVKNRKEVPIKKEINYDDDFEFEYGSYDE